MTVADLMVPRVEAISISKSITDAIRQMSEKKVDTLLVVDDQRCLKGFVDINFVERNISKLKPNTSVFEVMGKDTASVNQNDRVANVIEPLINHTYKYLPVVDDEEHLVGIVTRSSLVSLVQEQLQ
jgi:osmoprotectant transport system ATP-binding protein